MNQFPPLNTEERSTLSKLRQIFYDQNPELLRANWIKMRHPCGRSYCHCAKAKKYWHLSWYVSQSKKGKSRMKSVPANQRKAVSQWIRQYQQARMLLQKVGDLYWDRVGYKKKR